MTLTFDLWPQKFFLALITVQSIHVWIFKLWSKSLWKFTSAFRTMVLSCLNQKSLPFQRFSILRKNGASHKKVMIYNFIQQIILNNMLSSKLFYDQNREIFNVNLFPLFSILRNNGKSDKVVMIYNFVQHIILNNMVSSKLFYDQNWKKINVN